MILITSDKDFGELVFRQNKCFSGIIFLRLEGLSKTKKIEIIDLFLRKYNGIIENSFVVITPNQIRIRKF